MIAIEEHHVDAMASNAAAIRNARRLVTADSYPALSISADGAVLFGRCIGSQGDTYHCSVDLAVPGRPVSRCDCPSHQVPCKHGLGLLYAWVSDAGRFAEAELPSGLAAELTTGREAAVERMAKRAAKRQARATGSAEPKRIGVRALTKKRMAQLEALDLLTTLLGDLLLRGLGSHGAAEAEALRHDAARLRGAWLPGAELALLRLSALAKGAAGGREGRAADDPLAYHRAVDELARLEATIRRARAYLGARIENPTLAPGTETAIAAWLGHAWRHDELVAAGLSERAVELVQLAFFVANDRVRGRLIDTGVWMHLGDGRLLLTETSRPYRARDRVAADDSCFDVVEVPELVRYPGESPPRVRWEEQAHRPLAETDIAAVRERAEVDFATVLKAVRGALVSPLGAPHTLALLRPARAGLVGDGVRPRHVIEDESGVRIELADPCGGQDGGLPDIPPTACLLSLLGDRVDGAALLCRFHVAPDTHRLAAQPLTLVHADSLTRLAY